RHRTNPLSPRRSEPAGLAQGLTVDVVTCRSLDAPAAGTTSPHKTWPIQPRRWPSKANERNSVPQLCHSARSTPCGGAWSYLTVASEVGLLSAFTPQKL